MFKTQEIKKDFKSMGISYRYIYDGKEYIKAIIE
jgi:hypothetical protein